MAGKESNIGLIICIVGLLISMYAIYVEYKSEMVENYEATCDINESISCSSVFKSEYGHILSKWVLKSHDYKISNSKLGLLFYALGVIALKLGWTSALLGLSVCGVIMSAYLSYVLFYIIQKVCVLCFGVYVCNMSLFIVSCYISQASDSVAAADANDHSVSASKKYEKSSKKRK